MIGANDKRCQWIVRIRSPFFLIPFFFEHFEEISIGVSEEEAVEGGLTQGFDYCRPVIR
jgi:hypothetical protein